MSSIGPPDAFDLRGADDPDVRDVAALDARLPTMRAAIGLAITRFPILRTGGSRRRCVTNVG